MGFRFSGLGAASQPMRRHRRYERYIMSEYARRPTNAVDPFQKSYFTTQRRSSCTAITIRDSCNWTSPHIAFGPKNHKRLLFEHCSQGRRRLSGSFHRNQRMQPSIHPKRERILHLPIGLPTTSASYMNHTIITPWKSGPDLDTDKSGCTFTAHPPEICRRT